jgi:membrane protease YdiL (CAAX protease family)
VRAYLVTLAALWMAGAAAAAIYSAGRNIPTEVALPVAAAMLVELSLYAGLAFPSVRRRVAEGGRWLPAGLIASAVLPYLIYSLPTGVFDGLTLTALVALVGAMTFWFRLLPAHPFTDLAFLAGMAAVVLAKAFERLYPAPIEALEVSVLGELMWIRLGVFVALEVRRFSGLGFGFLPGRREWRIGLKYYAYCMPLTGALAYGLRFARFDLSADLGWRLPLTFLGALWVVALSEELFFRGVLQQTLARWWGATAGLVAASVAFGAVHLPFREFPNWEFAALAAVAGLFYGRAFLEGGGVRAAMVTHALVVTTWRALFR